MRLSSYVIFVPMERTGETVLVHGISGAVDRVSNEWARNMRAMRWDLFSEQDLADMMRRGYITEKTVEEERETAIRIGRRLREKAMRSASFILMPTIKCNLGCDYCFQNFLRTDGADTPSVDTRMVDAAFAAMAELQARRGARVDRILLFGGEPLLAENRPVLEHFFRKGAELGYRYEAVTNGTELHHYRDYLGPGKLEWVQITLDGPQEVHDRQRWARNGQGTYWQIKRNIDMALEQGVAVSLRMNVGCQNREAIRELVAEFDRYGWLRHGQFHPYCAPIRGEGGQQESTRLQRAVIRLVREMNAAYRPRYGRDVVAISGGVVRTKISRLLAEQPVSALTPAYCGAHLNMFVFSADGDIYTCWEGIGVPSARVGRFWPCLELDEESLSRWFERHSLNIPACQKCRYMFFCGGGCGIHALEHNDEFFSSYCNGFAELFRGHVEQAIAQLDDLEGVPIHQELGYSGV